MLQELAVKPGDRILEVGTGSGYMTALLAKRGAHVTSVEIAPELSAAAAAKLSAHGITNVTLEVGDAARGWSKSAPYDVIVLTGSVPVLADEFQRSLKPGGRLLAVVGEAPVMEARLITCAGGGACDSVVLFETCIPTLHNAPQPERFVF
jgi:protein-L-isoaspartate(D-aspartate) O-methyltransferase